MALNSAERKALADQRKRALSAARSAHRETVSRNTRNSVAVNPAMRRETIVQSTGVGPRKSRVSTKGQLGWNHSPYYKTATTIDSRWSATVSG